MVKFDTDRITKWTCKCENRDTWKATVRKIRLSEKIDPGFCKTNDVGWCVSILIYPLCRFSQGLLGCKQLAVVYGILRGRFSSHFSTRLGHSIMVLRFKLESLTSHPKTITDLMICYDGFLFFYSRLSKSIEADLKWNFRFLLQNAF